uniref:Uncharacterized protein MANES_01G231400 n=1 Tax=Rhizophora mucronata TaxID=61149 RepID=A0A2P2JQW5_RHIMU
MSMGMYICVCYRVKSNSQPGQEKQKHECIDVRKRSLTDMKQIISFIQDSEHEVGNINTTYEVESNRVANLFGTL